MKLEYQLLKLNQNKLFHFSKSNGSCGGKRIMEATLSRIPRHGVEIITHFSLPYFQVNFDNEKGITNEDLKNDFLKKSI